MLFSRWLTNTLNHSLLKAQSGLLNRSGSYDGAPKSCGVKPLTPAPELAARIQQRIDELQPKSPRAWPVRVCKEELNALPLHGNILFLWAIQPDGTVLCMDHEAFGHPTEPEIDPLTVYAVVEQGARSYPELQALIPACPARAQACAACGGQGYTQEATNAHCFRCSGLGWFIPVQSR